MRKSKKRSIYLIENYSELENGANPGLVFYEGNDIGKDLISFSKNAMDTILSKQLADKNCKIRIIFNLAFLEKDMDW